MADPEKTTTTTLKNKRRAAKSAFTRVENSLSEAIVANRTPAEISFELEVLREKLSAAEKAHENYTEDMNDDEYELEEAWINNVQKQFDVARVRVTDYCSKFAVSPVKTRNDALNMPKIPIPKFSGKIDDYLAFRSDWQRIVEPRYGIADDVLYLLRNALENTNPAYNARKWIDGVFEYAEAWAKLDQVYGNPRETSDFVIGELEKLKSLGENEFLRFVELFHKIKKAEMIMSEMERKEDLDNSTTLGVLERKLCNSDKLKWAECQLRDQISPNIDTFLNWMWNQIQIHKIAGADIRSSTNVKKGSILAVEVDSGSSTAARNTMNNTQVFPGSTQTPSWHPRPEGAQGNYYVTSCWYCKGEHKVDDCKRFKSLSSNDRLKEVRRVHACYFCLRRHKPPCRARRVKCPEPACRYSHHILLHGANFEKTSGTENDPGHTVSGTVGNCRNKKGECLLPILPVVVANKRVRCLLDSGSQLTLIRQDLAEELDLEGDEIEVEIVTVGDSVQKLKTKLYEIEISTISGDKSRKIEAIGFPKICENLYHVDKAEICDLFMIQSEDIDTEPGSVDILIGVDNIEFHTGFIIHKGDYGLRETIFGL
ncbi:uncharacterized protein LOC141906259 [Tubulanus polymorphus]|uniref:uncharacterized protein LOC141906259 n=1 Tax=Tubulanus polymorphus TaxID=672921 RepID=UPI003DA69076